MEKIQPIAGTKIKFFETPNFKEMEELVNKWIDETGSLHQYIYDIQYNHNMVTEEQGSIYGHSVSVMVVYGIE
ncbi:MAG TPA: DUF2536 family protein [Dehalococcoidia bacterium]|nr:DUF2536 family protein [Dehalococcoidia bacterium]